MLHLLLDAAAEDSVLDGDDFETTTTTLPVVRGSSRHFPFNSARSTLPIQWRRIACFTDICTCCSVAAQTLPPLPPIVAVATCFAALVLCCSGALVC